MVLKKVIGKEVGGQRLEEEASLGLFCPSLLKQEIDVGGCRGHGELHIFFEVSISILCPFFNGFLYF